VALRASALNVQDGKSVKAGVQLANWIPDAADHHRIRRHGEVRDVEEGVTVAKQIDDLPVCSTLVVIDPSARLSGRAAQVKLLNEMAQE